MTIKHYLQFTDLSVDEYAYVFQRAALIKKKFKAYEKHHTLADRTLAMIFEKASTRTRVSFEAGMYQLGGSVVHLTTGDSQLGRAERCSLVTLKDFPKPERAALAIASSIAAITMSLSIRASPGLPARAQPATATAMARSRARAGALRISARRRAVGLSPAISAL